MLRVFCFILLCIGLQSCTSLVEKGDELFQAGLYAEAADFYERALTKDQNNIQAKVGLDRARHQIIDKGLIEVRTLRLALNEQAAAEKLEQILVNQKKWSLALQGAVISTQAEELRYAKSWLLKTSQTLSQTKYPDQHRWFQTQFSTLIETTKTQESIEDHRQALIAQGKALCRSIGREVHGQRYFLKDFAEKYCHYWGKKPTFSTDLTDTSRFNKITILQNVTYKPKYNSTQRQTLDTQVHALKSIFQTSLWFSPKATQRLSLAMSGLIDHQRQRNRIIRKAKYKVQETITNQLSNGQESSRTIEQEKIHRYGVYQYKEHFSVNLRFEGLIQGLKVIASVNKTDQHQTESHDEHFPAARLKPMSATFLNTTDKLNGHLDHLTLNLIAALDQTWEDAYCNKQLSIAPSEDALRCGRLKPDHPQVNQWVESQFGVTYAQIAQLYAIQQN